MSDQAPKRVVSAIGRVGKDPSVKSTSAGDVAEFSLAVTTSYEDGVPAKWFDVSVWNAGLIESVQAEVYKGAHLGVEGFYSVRTGTDGREYAKISAHSIYLLDALNKSAREDAPARPAPAAAAPAPTPKTNGTDLPF